MPSLLHTLSIALLSVLLCGSAVALDAGEIVALKDMQAEWGTQLGWQGTPSCDWTHVRCDSDGHVETLWLSFNQLGGSIPDSIGNLQSLEQLQLFNNQLNGSIPDSIGNLSELKFLLLDTNQLSGSIPNSICNLQSLHQLFLQNNTLTGVVPSWVCATNASYDLRDNHFSCPLPTCCSSTGNGLCAPCFA
mmetsp:Transcript_15785/g.47378  ORF Transcript_15785/g.47378 Transcript_15785/m.47378 type:complete len:190 (-) Transcript_15785:85-654(-)